MKDFKMKKGEIQKGKKNHLDANYDGAMQRAK